MKKDNKTYTKQEKVSPRSPSEVFGGNIDSIKEAQEAITKQAQAQIEMMMCQRYGKYSNKMMKTENDK